MPTRSLILTILALICLLVLSVANAENSESATTKSKTSDELAISATELSILINPLTKGELIVEAEQWRRVVRTKAEAIAAALVAAKRGEQSTNPNDLNTMRAERTLLLDNLRVVVNEIEIKSDRADAETQSIIRDYRLYMSSVGGIRIDASDAASATKAISGWLRSEQGGLRWVWNFAIFIGILLFTRLLAAVSVWLLKRAFEKIEWPELLEDFLSKTAYWIIMIGGLLMALAALEVSMGPLLAMVGAAGFIVAFAMQDSLSNFSSGLMILFFRPFDIGDSVDAGGVSGVVESMNLMATTIKTFDNKKMIVPNNKIMGDVITNATDVDERRVDLVFGIGYDDDISQTIALLEEIVSQHPKVLNDPAPNIRLHELADSSVNFIVRPWVKTTDYWGVYWDVTHEVKQRFDAENIGIPYPQRDVHLHLADDSAKQFVRSTITDR